MSSVDSRLGFILAAIRGGKMGANEYRVLNLPRVSVYFNAGQVLATGTNTALFWDTVDYDTDSMFDTTANTRLTVKTPGVYLLHGSLNWAGSAAGYRQVWFSKNGAGVYAYVTTYDQNGFAGANNVVSSWQMALLAGDYVQFNAVQNSGGNLAVTAATAANRYNGFQATLLSTL